MRKSIPAICKQELLDGLETKENESGEKGEVEAESEIRVNPQRGGGFGAKETRLDRNNI